MQIKTSRFVTSVADMQKYPELSMPEIVMVGRSNVGKSSLINYIANNSSLARTGATPGVTRLINLYEINKGEFMLVDLPGYGFQAGAKSDRRKWSGLIERYFESRNEIRLVLFLIDIRHNPTEQDLQMYSYLNYLRIPFLLLASKADKLSRVRLNNAIQNLDSFFQVGRDSIIPFSSTQKTGREYILERIERMVNV